MTKDMKKSQLLEQFSMKTFFLELESGTYVQ
jgi:hypothetical protein